jgi:hypothetical protein
MNKDKIENMDYNFFLIGFSLRRNSKKADFFTLLAMNEKNFPIIVNDNILFFCDLELSAVAIRNAQEIFKSIRQIPKEIDFIYNIADLMHLIDTSYKDKDSLVLNCINILDDFLVTLEIPLPQKYKELLHPIADYLTFDDRLLKSLKQQNASRKELKEAIEWCIHTIFSKSTILTDNGELPLVDWIEEKKADNRKKAESLEKLIAVTKEGDINEIQHLQTQGIDIDSKDDYGYTALHRAVEEGCIEIVRVLVERGADIYIRNEDGFTPLHFVCRDGYFDLAEFFVKECKYKDLNIRLPDRSTPLHLASLNGYKDIVELLVASGADVKVSDKDNKNVIHYAASNCHHHIIEYFIPLGVDACQKDINGKTPLDISIGRCSKAVEVLKNAESKEKVK